MLGAIGGFTSKVYGSFPRLHLDTPSNMLKKVTMLAIPTLLLFGNQFMEFAHAGPLAYASCLAGCVAMGPFAPACWAACIPVLALPTP